MDDQNDQNKDQSDNQESILEFAFQHYLESYGLRSGVIKQLLSIAAGLRKFHEGSNETNFFAKYLYFLFNFEVSEPLAVANSSAKDTKTDEQFQGYAPDTQIINIGFDPFKGVYDTSSEQSDPLAKQRFSEEQVCVVVWSRHVFLHA